MHNKEFQIQQGQILMYVQKYLVFHAFSCKTIIFVCTDSGGGGVVFSNLFSQIKVDFYLIFWELS